MSIATENALTGSPDTEWSISGAGDTANLGFAREFSVNVGQTINFSCHGTGTVLDIYRIGYYGGLGWRKVAALTNTATTQPNPVVVAGTNGATTCTAWSTTASWAVPSNATSGLYVGVYRNGAGNNASYIPFVVRDDALVADVVVKTSDTTWALAYNTYGSAAAPLGGSSLYGSPGALFDAPNRAHFGSYHRPIVTRGNVPQTYWLNAEAPLIRFLERNGYNVKYVSSKDVDANAAVLNNAKMFISSGHDEYWSDGMRNAVEGFRDSGKHCLFMSANEVFWRIRFDAQRTGVYCYKDTLPGPGTHVSGEPLDPVSWTGTWKDTRWAGRKPENTITGTDFRMNGVINFTPVLSSGASFVSHPVWRNSALTTTSQTLTNVVGFEADSMLPVQTAPSAVILAAQNINIDGRYANDNGSDYTGNGTLVWGIISQRYPSGGVVVGFGTCQWAWALDAVHDRESTPVNTAAQQFTINLLRDLGAAPATLMSGMTLSAPASLDSYGIDPNGPDPDTTPPSAPTGLTASNLAATSFTLNWTASTDAVGVTAYDIYLDAVLAGTTGTTTANLTGLTAATAYSVTVKAKDAAGNVSAASTALPVTTSAAPPPGELIQIIRNGNGVRHWLYNYTGQEMEARRRV